MTVVPQESRLKLNRALALSVSIGAQLGSSRVVRLGWVGGMVWVVSTTAIILPSGKHTVRDKLSVRDAMEKHFHRFSCSLSFCVVPKSSVTGNVHLWRRLSCTFRDSASTTNTCTPATRLHKVNSYTGDKEKTCALKQLQSTSDTLNKSKQSGSVLKALVRTFLTKIR